jgi:hypothetical protein
MIRPPRAPCQKSSISRPLANVAAETLSTRPKWRASPSNAHIVTRRSRYRHRSQRQRRNRRRQYPTFQRCSCRLAAAQRAAKTSRTVLLSCRKIQGRGTTAHKRRVHHGQLYRWVTEYAKLYIRSHGAVIRVYDDAGNVIETHEHKGDFREG